MKILCFGDSNTYGFNPDGYFGGRYIKTWPDVLAELTGHKVINGGANGRTIPSGKDELSRINEFIEHENIDELIIMLGSNDILMGYKAETAVSKMEKLINSISLENSRILLIAPPVMKPGTWVDNNSVIKESDDYRHLCRLAASNLGCRFGDSSSWDINISCDGVHFTEDGHMNFGREAGKYYE